MISFNRIRQSALPAGALLLAMTGLPVAAQDAAQPGATAPVGPAMPKRIVRDCRRPETGEIVVCGTNERSPYRLQPVPERFDPEAGVDSVSRERNALQEGGEAGIGSCSTVGPGGGSGCMTGNWKRKREQKAGTGKPSIVTRIMNGETGR